VDDSSGNRTKYSEQLSTASDMKAMSALRTPASPTSPQPGERAEMDTGAALIRIRASLEVLREELSDLSRRLERPILEVAAFLESIQDLESSIPSTEVGSRLVVALQSYDMFYQEMRLVDYFGSSLTTAIGESSAAAAPPPALLEDAEWIHFHLNSARTLIEGIASDVPHAVSQVLQANGASPYKFRNWAVNRSLTEISKLTLRLAETTDRVVELGHELATVLGVDPARRFTRLTPEGDFEDSSVTLF
jgi:hypothetical protein